MLDYTSLEALATVLHEGSFERAARRLHVTPSAVSQRVKQLEERLGQVLVQRGSPCTGTEAGQRLCLHLEQVALLEHQLRRSHPGLLPDAPAPTLKLAVNADSLSTWFMDAMAAFTASFSVGGVAWPSGIRPGLVRRSSFSSSATCSTCRHSRRPASVPVQGVPRSTSTWPVRSSSCLMRCDTAEGVMCSLRAARSKLPSRTTAARAWSPV